MLLQHRLEVLVEDITLTAIEVIAARAVAFQHTVHGVHRAHTAALASNHSDHANEREQSGNVPKVVLAWDKRRQWLSLHTLLKLLLSTTHLLCCALLNSHLALCSRLFLSLLTGKNLTLGAFDLLTNLATLFYKRLAHTHDVGERHTATSRSLWLRDLDLCVNLGKFLSHH